MKIPKKIWTGLAAFSLVLLVGFGLSGRALAAVTQNDITSSDNGYTFINGATIQADIGGAGQVTFTDVNVFDSGDRDLNYVPDDSAGFCDPQENIVYNPSNLAKDIRYGINFAKGTDFSRVNLHGTYQFTAQMKLGYYQGNNCVGVLLSIPVQSNDGSAATKFQWNGNDIVNLNGNDQVQLSAVNNSDKEGVYLSSADNKCGVNAAINLDSGSTSKGIYFKLSEANRDTKRANPDYAPGVSKFLNNGGANCHFDGKIDPVFIAGSKGSVAAGYTSSNSASTTVANDIEGICMDNSHGVLDWLFCPLTSGMSVAAGKLESLIEGQLNFNIKQNLNETGGVHLAWSVIRDVASVFVVILLLVMVFSQAIGGGFLDPYTIKKLLPRLVIAVIAMQLSWDICSYLISLANDAGHGLKQIMLAPFPGLNDLDINSILYHLNPGSLTNAGAVVGANGLLAAVLVGGVIIGFMAIEGTFVLIFSLLVGILAALCVLLFRNVLIVALTMFSPIAFLAWTLSGSQGGMKKIWDAWKTNFSKLLMLFPLLIGIIYTGRIFAWIIADTNKPPAHAGFIDLITILVAYFAPYFIIFRAYKWGGGMLSAAGSGIAQARKGITNANAPWLRTMGKRFQGNVANRYKIAEDKERKAYEKINETDARIKGLQDTIKARRAQGKSSAPEEKMLQSLQAKRSQQEKDLLAAQKQNGRIRRAAYRVAAGKPIPSSRQQLEMLAKASEYKKELVDQKMAVIHQDYVEQLNSGATVGQAKAYIRDKYYTDYLEKDASGKIIKDADGRAKHTDGYTERAFYNWLVDTSSAMELGDTSWRTAGGTIPDLMRTYGFAGMMNADPTRYRSVAGWFPGYQPFNSELGGGPKMRDFKRGGKEWKKIQSVNPQLAAALDADDELAQLMMEDARGARILTNMEDPNTLKTMRPENYEMWKDMQEGLQAKQLEYQRRGINLELPALSRTWTLLDEQFKKLGTHEGRLIIRPMVGGAKSAASHIDAVLGPEYLESKVGIPSSDQIVQDAGGRSKDRNGIEVILPNESQLDEQPTRLSLRNRILQDDAALDEFAKTMAERDEYASAAHNVSSKFVYQPILEELWQSAQSDPVIGARVQQILGRIQHHMQNRVNRAVRDAVGANLSDAEVARIRADEQAAADIEYRTYSSIFGLGRMRPGAAPAAAGGPAAPGPVAAAAPAPPAGPAPAGATPPAAPAAAAPAGGVGGGTLIIPHGVTSVPPGTVTVAPAAASPAAAPGPVVAAAPVGAAPAPLGRESIMSMSEENAWRYVDARGGWRRMPDAEILAFYNTRRGELQFRARQELERRGYISPLGGGPRLP